MSINTTPAPQEAAEKVVITQLIDEKSVHTPVSTKKFPWKQVHSHRANIMKKIHPLVVADRRDHLLPQNEERMKARTLCRIKRRLFLDAVDSNQTHNSHHNLVRLEVTGKKNRMESG
jgi:hypothetical protein